MSAESGEYEGSAQRYSEQVLAQRKDTKDPDCLLPAREDPHLREKNPWLRGALRKRWYAMVFQPSYFVQGSDGNRSRVVVGSKHKEARSKNHCDMMSFSSANDKVEVVHPSATSVRVLE